MADTQVNIRAQDGVSPVLKKIELEMTGFKRQIDSFSAGFNKMLNIGGGVTAAATLYNFGDAALKTQERLEALSQSYTEIFSGTAKKELDYVYDLSKRLGLEFVSTAEGAKTFFAAAKGTDLAPQMDKIFEAVSGAGARLRLSGDQIQGVFLALGQMISKGKVQAEELRGQLGERLPGAFQIAARAMGMTTAELDKFMADGKLVTDDFLPKFAAELSRTASSSDGMANSLRGARNYMSGEWTLLLGDLADSSTGAAAFRAVGSGLEFVRNNLEGITQAATVAGAAVAAMALKKKLAAAESTALARVMGELKDSILKVDAVQMKESASARAVADAELTRIEREKMLLLAHERRAEALAARLVGTEKEARAEKVLAETRKRLAAVNGQLAASEARLTGAAAGISKSAATLQSLKKAGLGLVNFLGGPWGIALTAATVGVAYLSTRQTEAEQVLRKYADVTSTAEEALKNMGNAADGAAGKVKNLSRAQTMVALQDAQAEYKRLMQEAGIFALGYKGYEGRETPQLVKIFDEFLQKVQAGEADFKATALALDAFAATNPKLAAFFQEFVIAIEKNSGVQKKYQKIIGDTTGAMNGLSDSARTARAELLQPWSINLVGAQKGIAAMEKRILDMRGKMAGLGSVGELTSLMPEMDPAKIAQALKAYDPQNLAGMIRVFGQDWERLSTENRVAIFDTMKEAKYLLSVEEQFKAWQDKSGKAGASSAKKAAVAQADYTGELERTRQQIESLQEQLGLDSTETLTRAKIRIEQQYKDTLSKTREELEKQVTRGSMTQAQADVLRSEKEQAAELQKRLSLRDAEQKATEKESKDLQLRADFYKDLADRTGEYDASLEYQNSLLERQAEIWIKAKVPMQDVTRMLELQRLEMARDPWSGMARSAQKFYTSATDYAAGFEQISTQALNGFSSSLSSVLWKGEQDFSSFFQSIGQMLTELALKASMAQILGGSGSGGLFDWIGSLFRPTNFGGAASGLTSSIPGAGFGGAASGLTSYIPGFHSGGMSFEPSFYRPVPRMLFARAPRFHNGRFYDPASELPAIIRKDESVLTPGQMRALARAPVPRALPVDTGRNTARNTAPVVNITVINQAGAEVETSRQQNSDGGIDLEIMVTKAVARDMGRRNGATNKVLRNQFGASKRPIKY